MPFQKKVKASVDLIDPEVTPGTPGNDSVDTKKITKEKIDVAAEIRSKRELYKKDQELEEKDKEIEEIKKQLRDLKNQPAVTQAPDATLIAQMQAQISQLSMQVVQGAQGKKLMFRQPTAADVGDDTITFTARAVTYIVASYIDLNGIEKLPPFKLIVFNYAASDIRKEGREEEIKNFSQFTTNLKPEIEFLRAHPFYGITFSANTNEMMNEDTKKTEFKTKAALIISTLSPENVFDKAKAYNIPNWRTYSAAALKPVLIQKMTEEFEASAKVIEEEILKRRMLAQALNDKE
jgi:hypothetical protein